ncbi:MAG: clan AA aspartic protease [Bacteroidales bacterium]|nr:clan AA aspartic protease [Bacteroidales bacterium]
MTATNIPLHIQYLDNRQNIQPIISVSIARKEYRMIVDTGASHSCLSPQILGNRYQQSAINVGDKVLSASENVNTPTLMCKLPGIRIGDIYLRQYSFLILDISHINEMLKELQLPPVAGLIGSDILQKYHALIDYGRQRLTLYR